jgi:3-hydroxybutyryl-CoA dehydrogenase
MKKVGVIGAGTMGSGIIQTFAEKGFDVSVFESYVPARENAVSKISKGIQKRVEKKQITPEEGERSISRIHWCESLNQLAETEFVVEAIIEDFNAKLPSSETSIN